MKHDNKKPSGGRLREIILSPGATIGAFILAAVLLLFAGIGGARAALTYFSETYASRVGMYHIGVTLLENDKDVSYRNYSGDADGTWDEATGVLLSNMLADGEDLKIGTAYAEKLSVRNSSGENTRDNDQGINQFVRVSVYKYWLTKPVDDPAAKKATDLDEDMIDLHFVNVDGDNSPWIIDKKASTPERTVLYHKALLKNGEKTDYFTDTLTIKDMVAKKVKQSETVSDKGKTITTTYDYDGYSFAIEATVDAVQQHNAQDAILSAWGRKVTISGSGDDLTLSLAD